MRKIFLVCLFILTLSDIYAFNIDSSWHYVVGAELQSAYINRGVRLAGEGIQPYMALSYSHRKIGNFTFEMWFSLNYNPTNEFDFPKFYREMNLTLFYSFPGEWAKMYVKHIYLMEMKETNNHALRLGIQFGGKPEFPVLIISEINCLGFNKGNYFFAAKYNGRWKNWNFEPEIGVNSKLGDVETYAYFLWNFVAQRNFYFNDDKMLYCKGGIAMNFYQASTFNYKDNVNLLVGVGFKL